MSIELNILDWFQTLHTPFLDKLMVFITSLGNAGIIWIVMTIVFLLIPKMRKTGAVMAVALIIDLLLCNVILKNLVARTRPYDVNTGVQLLVSRLHDYSFPSGHTAAAFASVTALYLAGEKKLWKPVLVLACLIGISRLYLYVHYPTDVLGGVLAGAISGYLGYRFIQAIFLQNKTRRGRTMSEVKNKKKKSSMIQVSIGVLAVILAILIIIMMEIVSDIQGTARIVNYTGLVRGETQRIIKLEVAGEQDDAMIQEVRSFIDGLRNGNTKLNLVYLNDTDFQNKMQELDEGFSDLYKEICLGRFEGYEKTDIISRSEDFFVICDEATGLAEKYSQKKATSLSLLEKYITADIVVLMLLIGYEFIKAIQYAAMNRLLQRKVYLDDATGLPNKNKCEELLSEEETDADTGVCSFDLNNLRRINDSRGHEAGDAYIRRFAICLRASIPVPGAGISRVWPG